MMALPFFVDTAMTEGGTSNGLQAAGPWLSSRRGAQDTMPSMKRSTALSVFVILWKIPSWRSTALSLSLGNSNNSRRKVRAKNKFVSSRQ
jgi:hypothetical protein